MTIQQKMWGAFPRLWQSIFLVVSASWLFAPLVNDVLSKRATLISEYELSTQPYSTFFRLADVLAGLLIVVAAKYIHDVTRHKSDRRYSYIFIAIGALSMIDALATTNCLLQTNQCLKQFDVSFTLHAIETVSLALILFGVSCYHAIRHKSLASTTFVIFQLLYGIFSVTRISDTYNFQTLSQYVYQVLAVVWIAWFLGELLQRNIPSRIQTRLPQKYVHSFFAIWAYINGTLAILISLSHIHVFGFIEDLYFASNNAWIAEHGVIIGVYMLYLSYHLWRGENRARQVFLVLLFIEVIKYSVVTPEALFLVVYWLSFVALFSLRSYFKRGAASLDWHARVQEVGIILSGVLATLIVGAILLNTNARFARIAKHTAENFMTYATSHARFSHGMLRSELLARTLVTFMLAIIAFILWALFRPANEKSSTGSTSEVFELMRLLDESSRSSEDFFKVWPHDKNYFWSNQRDACIAYKIHGSVVFALANPIAKTTYRAKDVLTTFVEHWRHRGYTVCFVLVDENSLALYEKTGFKSMQIGSSAVVTIEQFMNSTVRNKWWRWQQNRATKAGYTYKTSMPPHSPELLRQLSHVSSEWLKRPDRKEQGFAMGSYSTDYMDMCIVHYLEDADSKVLAFTNQVPVFNDLQQGTMDLIRFEPDRDHAMPYLLAQTIMNDTNHRTFDLGFVPLAKTKGNIAAITRVLGRKRFSAAGLEQFKGKFEPTWMKNYIAYDGDLSDLAAIALNLEGVMKPGRKNKTP